MENKVAHIKELAPYSFFLSILVLMIHNPSAAYFDSLQTDSIFNVHYFLRKIIPAIDECAVPSFFVISSFLFFRTYKIKKTLNKLKSRVGSLFVPYLIWNTYALLVAMLFQLPSLQQYTTFLYNPFELSNILKGIFFYLYSPFWFIFALMLWNLFCPVFYYLCKNGKRFLISFTCIYALLALTGFSHPFSHSGYIGEVFNISSVLYYMIGAFLGLNFPNAHSYSWSNKKIFLGIILFIAALCIELGCNITDADWYYPLLIFFKCFLMWMTLKQVLSRVSVWWVHISFFIYAIHGMIQKIMSAVVRLLVCRIFGLNGLSEFLTWSLSILFTVVVIVMIAKIWKKISQSSFSFATGGR